MVPIVLRYITESVSLIYLFIIYFTYSLCLLGKLIHLQCIQSAIDISMNLKFTNTCFVYFAASWFLFGIYFIQFCCYLIHYLNKLMNLSDI